MKKLVFDEKKGLVEEKELDSSGNPPSADAGETDAGNDEETRPERVRHRNRPSIKASGQDAGERPASGGGGKADSHANRRRGTPRRTILDENVIRFRCPRCGSERVGDSREAVLRCGLCGTRMKLAQGA